jgi:TolB protein
MDYTYRSYLMDADGSNRVTLLERQPVVLFPTACGPADTAVVALLGDQSVLNLYRVNLTTGELKRLTNGTADQIPSCTPDGKWAVYLGNSGGQNQIMKVSSEGGTPAELARGAVSSPCISPDGKLVAYSRRTGEGAQQRFEFVIQSIEGGPPIKELPQDTSAGLSGWMPDGQALMATQGAGLYVPLFRIPIDGSERTQLTHFDSEPLLVGYVAFSRDGKQFAITRQRYNTTDAVVFTNFR